MISRFMQSCLRDPSPIRVAYERAEGLKQIYGADAVFDYSIGNPTAPCPEGVRDALAETLAQSKPPIHGYMQDSGYEDVRAAVAHDLNERFDAHLDAQGIVMTAGAACGLNALMRTILDRGDEVAVFLPCFPGYAAFARNWGANLTKIPYVTETILPDLDAFRNALNSRMRMAIVNSPHNPTGFVYSDELAKGIASILTDWKSATGNDVMLVSDEPYRELVFEGAATPWWPSLYENTAVVYSWSKSASIAGERIGYVALSPAVPERDNVRQGVCRSIGELGFVNAPATAQRIALHCLRDTVDASYYDANRRLLLDGLHKAGLKPLPANGAFYLLVPAPDGDEGRFIERLSDERIVVVGGTAFGCPGYVRLSYCMEPAVIERSLPGFVNVARTYSEERSDRS